MKQVLIEAEDFRDKAWGVYSVDDEHDLVLEMTEGYSDLYLAQKGHREPCTEEFFYEEEDRREINNYCRTNYGVEFVTWREI